MDTVNVSNVASPVGVSHLIRDYATVSCLGWLISLAIAASLLRKVFTNKSSEPPRLPELIPYVSNAYQYLTDNSKFLQRATEALKKSNIVGFNLGPVRVYLVSGSHNVQKLFRKSSGNTKLSSDKFVLMVNECVQGIEKADAIRWASDKSGRLKIPAPGTEAMPEEKRIWSGMHHVFAEHLTRADSTAKLAQNFQAFFNEKLEQQPLGEWRELQMFQFLKNDMAEAAIVTLAGRRLIERHPEFVKLLWDFDEVVVKLMYGMPSWINPEPKRRQDRAISLMTKFLTNAWSAFDWDGPDADADWDPIFGSRLQREHAKLWKQKGFNVNTIPETAWVMMELIRDPALLKEVRDEIQTTLVVDPKTGYASFDVSQLLTLPLLQSIYSETLRLHVSINITREVLEPIDWDGYTLPKGSLIQAPTRIGLQDETVWGVEGHPASEFWAERHIKYGERVDEFGETRKVREFCMNGRPSDFFPYGKQPVNDQLAVLMLNYCVGGGVSICPGRFFAKQEIMLAVAMIVSRFDVEFVEWVKYDGTTSDRPAADDKTAIGSGAVSPDRDMRVRWRRIA
ncbi:hypothetical protein CPLU01_13771 [Colletotrichum plurivorum]|uniref:Cytochrome P450 n=1 Tax=Colletotrichum plurivorum TaxID=2175906 RepID=A0A8H6N244_9PEZI|nr:hypothetical protein CPLU01_13771 [Colletotrichum plurivorum]